MNEDDLLILKRALAREKAARKQAEKILEDKSRDLYVLTKELQETNLKLQDLVGNKESKLQSVFANLVDAYVLMDLKGNIVEMNHAAMTLFGYDITKEAINVVSLIYKDDYIYAMTSFKELISKGSFSDYQARVYTKNNGVRTVHINASIIKNSSSQEIRAQGIIRDITDEIAQKQLIQEQKKQLSIIVDNSSLGIVLTQDGKIIQANKAFQTLLGYDQKQLTHKSISEISINSNKETTKEDFEKMNRGEIDSFSINRRYIKKDDSFFWAKTNISAVRNVDKTIKYKVALIEDITEQLEFEKQRDKFVKDLEKTNQELKDYAHIVSHDLKSPLRNINALVNWIKEDCAETLNETGHSHLTMIENTLEKMESLISDILNYSRAGDTDTINTKKIDLNTLIEDIKNLILVPKTTSITVLNKLPTIHADSAKIQQLFQNLIGNAVNYIDKKIGIIEIDYIEKKHHYLFTIRDNGIGIHKKYHKKIFKIFQSIGDNEKSTGVGLAIVKKIVDMYEGEIWLESTPNVGTTFFFTIKKNNHE